MVVLAKYRLHYQCHPDSLLDPDALVPALSAVPSWVFAMLRGPLLAANTRLSSHRMPADMRTWLLSVYSIYRPHMARCHAVHLPPGALLRSRAPACVVAQVYSSLPFEELVVAVHPTLSGYATEEECSHPELPLSWDALGTCGARLFVLDAFTCVYVYLADGSTPQAGAEVHVSFPPSKSSALWAHVADLKQRRLHTPRVVVCRAGSTEAEGFAAHICEDGGRPAADGAAHPEGSERFSFRQFLEFVGREAQQMNV